MQRIKYIKTGKIKFVSNNIAHGLIERGVAKLFRGKDKMMKPSKKRKGYIIK